MALTEGATRWPRWSVGQTVPDTLLRDAGKQLRESGVTSGTVLAYSATFSSYSGLTRGRLTPNALPTIVAYAGRTYRGPVYLELSTLEREVYDPSVRALLDGKQAPFPVVLDLADARGRAVVFRMQ